MKRRLGCLLELLGLGLFLAIVAACIRNVLSANLELQQMATAAACGTRPDCSMQLRQFMRTPIEHTYWFVTPTQKLDPIVFEGGAPAGVNYFFLDPTDQFEVRCRREFTLFGDYACTATESELTRSPAASAAAPASASAPTSASPRAPASASPRAPAGSGKPRR